MILHAVLLLVFLVHLVAFAAVGLRRRQRYYLALVLTFALLSATMAANLFAPQASLPGGLALAETLRVGAWLAAAVSIGWTLLRMRARLRARRQAMG
jgi:hypothetical membrane protein